MMRFARCLLAATLGLVSAGCLVQIETIRDPSAHFERARREAERFQGRPGPAHELNVLDYDADDHKLVRVQIPMWLARKIANKVDWDDDRRGDDRRGDPDEERVKRALRRHVDLHEIERAGLGILVEVVEDGGEQVLVWLR